MKKKTYFKGSRHAGLKPLPCRVLWRAHFVAGGHVGGGRLLFLGRVEVVDA